MLERLKTALVNIKTALVDSFVGAIALGSLFAYGVMRFVDIFIEPITHWITQRQFWEMSNHNSAPPPFPYQFAFTNLLTSAILLLIAYGLLRWLYYSPRKVKKKGRRQSRNLWARVR
jgi:Zn-dependent protease